MVQQEVGQERGEQRVSMEWIDRVDAVDGRVANSPVRSDINAVQECHRMLAATQRVAGNRIGRHRHDSCEVFEGHAVSFVEYTTE